MTVETDDQSELAPQRRRSAGDWIKIALLLLALAFGGYFVASRWSQLVAVLDRMNGFCIAGSVVAAAAGTVLGAMGWREMLIDLGARLPVAGGLSVFLVGQLGKYVPGSIWSLLAQVELSKQYKVSRKAVLTGGLLGIAANVAAGLMVACALLPFASSTAIRHYWWVLLVVPALFAALHPSVAGTVIDRSLRLIRRQPLDQRPSYQGMLRTVGWFVLGWLALGVHAWLLVTALGADVSRSLFVAMGGFALAVCLGLLFLPAPAGAGVRDVALTVALSPVLGPTEALAVALVSRVILAVLDFVLAGLAALWVRQLKGQVS